MAMSDEDSGQGKQLRPNEFTFERVSELADRSLRFLQFARKEVFEPNAEKTPPTFNLSELAQALGVDKSAITRRLAAEGNTLPAGRAINATRKEFTVTEYRQWLKAFGVPYQRQPDQTACVVVVPNSKGGVSKTYTAVNVAQGLALRGYQVLVIDLDPQGSATALLGFSPEIDIEYGDTFAPLAAGETDDLRPAVRSTYMDGVDLVPASVSLHSADFQLPARQVQDRSFQFWEVLNNGLKASGLIAEYDYIVIDTPPAMSYSALNAFWSADAMLVPMPPEGADIAASVQFWSLLGELTTSIQKYAPEKQKVFSWIRVLPSKVNRQVSSTTSLLDWLRTVYGPELLPLEIPLSAAVSVAGATFRTIYDTSRYDGSAKTYARVREAYDALVDEVDRLSRMYKWNAPAAVPRQAAEQRGRGRPKSASTTRSASV